MILKKLLAFSLLLVGVCFGAVNVNAAAYVGDTDNIKVDAESNKEAIRLLTESGEIDEVDIPLDKIGYEPPKESINNLGMQRKLPTSYNYFQSTYLYGMYQLRSQTLAPAGFNWKDNGIPANCTSVRIPGSSGFFSFKLGTVSDAGFSGYDAGYYWRKFNTPWGSFWASAWNLDHLIYG